MANVGAFYNELARAYLTRVRDHAQRSNNKINFLQDMRNVCDVCNLQARDSSIKCTIYFPYLALAETDLPLKLTGFMCLKCTLEFTDWFLVNPDVWLGKHNGN